MSENMTTSGRSTEISRYSQTPSGQVDDMEESTAGDYRYKCPFCETQYENEILTRVHVTRSESDNHINKNGFMPEIEIKCMSDGEVVDSITRRPNDIDPTTITTADLPANKSEIHKQIILVATHNPSVTNYERLTELAAERLEENGLESRSYATIRRVVQEFFRPGMSNGIIRDENKETLGDLTPKQQAIVIYRLLKPTYPLSTIADRVGCAVSYPGQVLSKAEQIVSELEKRINEEDPVGVLEEELDDEDILNLEQRGLLEDVGLDEISLKSQRDNWGSPLEQSKGMSAAPQTSQQMNQETSDKSDELEGNSNSEKGVEETRSNDNNLEYVDATEVERLKDKVVFLRSAIERMPDEKIDDADIKLISFAEQVERLCDEILCN